MRTSSRFRAILLAASVVAGTLAGGSGGAAGASTACAPGGGPVRHEGHVTRADARSYRVLPVDVAAGTTRIEVAYGWADSPVVVGTPPSTPITQTVLDLGLWDTDGYTTAAGFRGWSGSRAGKQIAGSSQPPVFVQADVAERGYLAGPVDAGRWWVDLGIAAVGPSGASWWVEVRCRDIATGPAKVAQPVDASHVARATPGWYFGDMHMHGYHSAGNAPSWDDFVARSRAAGLDFLPVTDYVTSAHWGELGPVQAANPDLLIWPGREIITYFGHANAIGETPSVLEFRHGFDDGNGYRPKLSAIQSATRADGALFQVNHPTFFPGPLFQNFCRGCEFELKDEIDWGAVDTIEVLTGPAVANPSDAGAPSSSPSGPNPFTPTAIDLWHRLLLDGHKITAVSGSDSKGNEPSEAERVRRGYGSSATAVYADELSRPALKRAIRAGHVYIAARGKAGSPTLEMTAVTPDGQRGMFGDVLRANTADITIRVQRGAGQLLQITRNGAMVLTIPVLSDDFSYTFAAARGPLEGGPDEGPLGTFWRADTLDSKSLTTIGNPIFLAPPEAA